MIPKRIAIGSVSAFAVVLTAGMVYPDVSLIAIAFVSGLFFGVAMTIAVLDDMERQP